MSHFDATSSGSDIVIDQCRSAGDKSPERQSPKPTTTSVAKKMKVLSHVELHSSINHDAYQPLPGKKSVRRVLREISAEDEVAFRVQFGDYHEEMVSFENLLKLDNGSLALSRFNENLHSDSSRDSRTNDTKPRVSKGRRTSKIVPRFTESTQSSSSGSISDTESNSDTPQRRPRRKQTRLSALAASRRISFNGSDTITTSDSEDEISSRRRSKPRKVAAHTISKSRGQRVKRRSQRYSDDISDSSSALSYTASKVKRRGRRPKVREGAYGNQRSKRLSEEKRSRHAQIRQSERTTRHQRSMEETALENLYRSGSEGPAKSPPLKVSGAREIFKSLPADDDFRNRHCQYCDTCGSSGNAAQLVFCQGCILAYHRGCLGSRSSRDHLVTKVSEDDFVLQCRRCVNVARKREPTTPDHGKCQACRQINPSSIPFRERKTPLQEQREREDNGGEDLVSDVSSSLLYNPANILFRCMNCWRGFHMHHLESRNPNQMDFDDMEETAKARFAEHNRDWKCKDCLDMPAKVAGLIAWRPREKETYISGFSADMMDEEDKEYLIKWEKMSYFRAKWMSGAWTWGVTAASSRRAFIKKETGPKMQTEDAIPEDYLRIDIVLDVKFTSIVDIRTEEIDKARIKEVDKALLKFKGLGYEDAVWENVPSPEDGDRWTDFVTAYHDWVMGRYIHVPKHPALKARLDKARAQPFSKLAKTKQPANLVGGELMKYQVDGLNWLYYRWYLQKNAILADEMGLGKTIQIIGLLATLVQDHTCFPFLLVVPNSTCPNWRREIKRWAPSLRVVAYYGSTHGRKLTYDHELYPEGSKTLRCHVVVTSYDAASDDSCARFFRSVPWAGLVVDEGQRLKNDTSLLYEALNRLKVPFRILLTGTPLQNNVRELFNLLQFLDTEVDAAVLEEEFAELSEENVRELHNRIRPYFLRRTKAQVLSFLPPMAQIIVPVSMTVLQKKLYMSILAKNPDLLRSIFSADHSLKPSERASLSNIIMQLRKCLCHPFVYNQEIEERTDIAAASHRNLVDASSKLKFLELLLPKLQAGGHRVLIFSQFLDMLSIVEDFLDGLEIQYQRLDGSLSAMQKQKRIDEFNAPDSNLFAFLLSTRAGGVGINLATADTVIILDPDFNPHQDIQALSRAHRIGQKKKVLCYQLMTRASVEEKIIQIGRKKMALDHVIVEQMGTEEADDLNLESILQYGAAELFDENGESKDIQYDEASIEKLLDRSEVENTKSGEDNSAESQFSFARVWVNDEAAFQDTLGEGQNDKAPDPTVWDKILKDREKAAAEAAAAKAEALGRGKRTRTAIVDYGDEAVEGLESPKNRQKRKPNESDTDFQENESSAAESVEEEEIGVEENAVSKSRSAEAIAQKIHEQLNPFKRVKVAKPPTHLTADTSNDAVTARWVCPACGTPHPVGSCPLKIAGVERCNLCGLAHYGQARACPHINSETQVRAMLEALKYSSEPRHLVEAATKYLRGVKGHLVQKKKRDMEKAAAAAASAAMGGAHGNGSHARSLPGVMSYPVQGGHSTSSISNGHTSLQYPQAGHTAFARQMHMDGISNGTNEANGRNQRDNAQAFKIQQYAYLPSNQPGQHLVQGHHFVPGHQQAQHIQQQHQLNATHERQRQLILPSNGV